MEVSDRQLRKGVRHFWLIQEGRKVVGDGAGRGEGRSGGRRNGREGCEALRRAEEGRMEGGNAGEGRFVRSRRAWVQDGGWEGSAVVGGERRLAERKAEDRKVKERGILVGERTRADRCWLMRRGLLLPAALSPKAARPILPFSFPREEVGRKESAMPSTGP